MNNIIFFKNSSNNKFFKKNNFSNLISNISNRIISSISNNNNNNNNNASISCCYSTRSKPKLSKKSSKKSNLFAGLFDKNLVDLAQGFSQGPNPPKKTVNEIIFGVNLKDDYSYMNEMLINNDAQRALLAEQNYFDDTIYRELGSSINTLERELKSIAKLDDFPLQKYRLGDYYYYFNRVKGFEVGKYCRTKGLDGEEEVILDFPALLSRSPNSCLDNGVVRVSSNHRYIGYTIDPRGRGDEFELRLAEVSTNKIVDVIKNVGSLEFDDCGRYVYYSLLDDSKRAYKVCRYDISGSEPTSVVYEELNPNYQMDFFVTMDRKFVVIKSTNIDTCEIRVVRSNQSGEAKLLLTRSIDYDIQIDHLEDKFYLLEKDRIGSSKFSVFQDDMMPRIDVEYIEFKENLTFVEKMCISKFGICLVENFIGNPRIRFIDSKTYEDKIIDLPFEFGCCSSQVFNDPCSEKFSFIFNNPLIPAIVYEFDMITHELVEKYVHKLPKPDGARKQYNPDDYVVERIYVPTSGGTQIPITLIRKKEIPFCSDNIVLLNSYGGLGMTLPFNFDIFNIPLLLRGWIIAYPHIRGCADVDQEWYEDGRGINKINSLNDIENVVNYFIDQKYTSPGWILGRAAGMGAVAFADLINRRPNALKALVLHSPVVDILASMRNDSFLSKNVFLNEFGNPSQRESFEKIHSYDPYYNIKSQNYPSVLVLASISNYIIPPWSSLRYVSKLRQSNTDDQSKVLLSILLDRSSSEDPYDFIKTNAALEIAFMYNSMGILPERI